MHGYAIAYMLLIFNSLSTEIEVRDLYLMDNIEYELVLPNEKVKYFYKNMFQIWSRPVAVATVMDGDPKIVSYDGTEFKHQSLSSLPVGDQQSSGETK